MLRKNIKTKIGELKKAKDNTEELFEKDKTTFAYEVLGKILEREDLKRAVNSEINIIEANHGKSKILYDRLIYKYTIDLLKELV